ncbi:B3 domain-containing protein IDEF1 [Rhynchospora pubera]|uniref:B3 domain-containing protein IDEF1 n=1 Tax=Rhynchospora pubera TaxID=906938 RepID=A0AAV8E0M4_9POAL|nr:B3 domain-containing protein IDEF1 [Rhynchospora pubera]
MLPMKTSGPKGGIDSMSKSYSKNEGQQSETKPDEKERCGVSQVSSQFISVVPDSTAVPALPFQPGFPHFEHSTNHFQWQISFPYPSPVDSLRIPQTLNNQAPCAFYAYQDSVTYNCIDPHYLPHFNLCSGEIRNPIVPPSIQQDNNFISIGSDNNSSVNLPFPRPDGTSEIMQSRNLEDSPTFSSCREFSSSEVSGHQIFSQSQNLINQRLSHEVMTIVTRKELTKSDVGSIGRIVIPKKDAEANFPPLFDRDGILLPMDDVSLHHITWEFKYRFWPNNKSRMYILENTGEFVKTHGLQAGDYLSIYRSPALATYFVKGEKRF